MPSPYRPTASQVSRFPFASRTSNAPAPLFFSATDEFREEDDGEEHEREVADFYALQRSRRHFGKSHLTESSELDDEAGRSSPLGHSGNGDDEDVAMPGFRRGRGIRSSWKGERSVMRGRPPGVEPVQERAERGQSLAESEASAPSSKGKGKLVDVELASTVHESAEASESDATPSDFEGDYDDHPPPIQQFRRATAATPSRPPLLGTVVPQETDEETARLNPRPLSPYQESVPPGVAAEHSQPPLAPRHDPFWATLFWICLAALLATFFLVWLDTSTPGKKSPLGDTIYTTLRRSFRLLGADTIIAAVVAVLWLSALRSFARPLVMLLTVAVPIILFSFFLYPLLSSYGGSWHGGSIQDKAMRWLSFIPGFLALMWIYVVYRGRHSYETAIQILEFGCRILEKSPALIITGFANLIAQIAWLWIWMLMFSRVFLGGHMSKSSSFFVIDGSTWWAGVFFVLAYLWVAAVLSGVQRATTAATVSQWYFHRLAEPAPSSRMVVQASLAHATTTLFGTICLSTLLSLGVRLPLLLLPRRAVAVASLCAYSLVPTPIAALTNPLALTYAAIHSRPLAASARGLAALAFVSKTSPTTTLTPTAFGASGGPAAALLPYRLAKLILHATRWILSVGLGFRGWVATARALEVGGGGGGVAGVRGSLYAYIVGLVAAAIGWGVSGAMEGVLLGVVDAVVVCWGSEVGADPSRQARYCREAGELFGESGKGEERRLRREY